MKNFERYHRAVEFLEGLSNLPLRGDYMVDVRHTGVYLKRMRYFLDLIGDPCKDLKYIHVTGTAGKGTVTTMVHEVLSAAGKRVGSFTSPFVTTSIEKIRVNNAYIDPNEFADIVEYLKPFIDTAYLEGTYGRPSYFEISLAIALVYFERKKCEWVVLEVGMGGRFDATNVIEKPLITAITNIDYDHTEFLGKTLKEIAYDKAGIIKKGSAFFTTEQRPPLKRFFAELCAEKKVQIHQLPRERNYQDYNKALAIAIAESLGIEDRYIKKGIQHTRLQCRFEVMQHTPRVILDGAHNRSKIRSTLHNLKQINFKKLHLVIGIAENKDHAVMLREIIPLADSVFVTRFQIRDRKCADPKELLQKAQRHLKKDAKTEIFLDPQRALSRSLQEADANDLVLVVGSFFLAGELRQNWFTEESILKRRKSF